MKLYLLVLFFFLLAFGGLGIGLVLKGKRLRGGCGHDPDSGQGCRCKDTAPETLEDKKESD